LETPDIYSVLGVIMAIIVGFVSSFAVGRLFSLGILVHPPIYNVTNCNDITEILFKVALNTIFLTLTLF
jgi:hypothetical protein